MLFGYQTNKKTCAVLLKHTSSDLLLDAGACCSAGRTDHTVWGGTLKTASRLRSIFFIGKKHHINIYIYINHRIHMYGIFNYIYIVDF